MLFKYLLLINFITFSLYATSIDSKIVDANSTTLKVMLKKLQTEHKANNELQFQKIILQQILSLEKKSTTHPAKLNVVIKNQQEYADLLKNYFLNNKEFYEIKRALKETEDKLNILQERIKESNATVEATFTQQLQYAYYKKELTFKNKQIADLQTRITMQEDLISKNIKQIKFNNKDISTKLQNINDKQKQIEDYLLNLQLKKEKFEFLKNNRSLNNTLAQIQLQQKTLQKLLEKKFLVQFLFFSMELQQKNKKVFDFEKEMQKTLKSLSLPDTLKESLSNFIYSLTSKEMGLLTTVAASTDQSIENSFNNIMTILNKPLFSINTVQVSFLKLMIALMIFLIGFFVGGVYKRYIKHLSTKSSAVSSSTRTLLSNLGYYSIVVITLFISLNVLGVNLSSITLVAGALSVGIGFGLQNIVSNFISGIILMFEKSVKVGDYVELSDSLRGKVADIRMRSTVITTNANIDVIVPNQTFIQNNVINWTMNDNIKRFEIPFGVAYGTDVNKVMNVVLEAVKNSNFTDIYTSKEKFTRVIMTEMGDSSVNFMLFVWIKGEDMLYPKRTTSKFLILIYNALNKNNITIPFPQLDLHVKKD